MNMKKVLFLLASVLTYVASFGNVEVFKTLEDFKNNTPEKYSDELKYFAKGINTGYETTITVENNGIKKEIQAKDIWGFKYKNILFRTYKYNLQNIKGKNESFGLAALVSEGKICYWENAMPIIEVLDKPEKKKVYMPPGFANGLFFLSLSNISEIKVFGKNFREFFNENKEVYTILKECLSKDSDFNKNMKMVKMMNKMMKFNGESLGEDEIAYISYLSAKNKEEIIRPCINLLNNSFNSNVEKSIIEDK